MKRKLLIFALTVLSFAGMRGQPFTVATLNVDGLPEKILLIPLNNDGPGANGTARASQYLANKGYDIIGQIS